MSITQLRIQKAQLIGDFIMSSWSEEEIKALLNIATDEEGFLEWKAKPSLNFIFKKVCRYFEQSEYLVASKARTWETAYPRHVFAYLVLKIYNPEALKETSVIGYKEKVKAGIRRAIAKIINREGPSVNNSIKVIENLIDTNKVVKAELKYIENELYKEFLNGQN